MLLVLKNSRAGRKKDIPESHWGHWAKSIQNLSADLAFFFFFKEHTSNNLSNLQMGKTNFLRICWFWIQIAIQFQGNDFLGLRLIALLKDCALRHPFAQRREEIGFCRRATPQCPGDWFCWPSHTVRILSLESCQALPCLEDFSAPALLKYGCFTAVGVSWAVQDREQQPWPPITWCQ